MATPVTSLPNTSSAVNIQIIEPKNFPNGAVPGTITTGAPQPAAMTGNPQQDLQNAYQNAVNARSQAEQALNNYMQMANNLNNPAYPQQQQQMAGYPAGYMPPGTPVYNNQPVNQQQGYPYPYPYYPQQPFTPQPIPTQPEPQQPPAAPAQAQQQQQAPQQPPQQPEQAQPPQQAPQQPEQKGLDGVPVDQLNAMIANPKTLQDKVDAMEELAVRGQGTPETYDLLKREATTDTGKLSGPQQDEANYVRQAALWTLGMLNRAQNANTPTQQLPGLSAIDQIIKSKNENPDVKAAAVQALQVMNRATDPTVKKILQNAAKDKNQDIKTLAQQALSGAPAPGAAPGQFAGGATAPRFAGQFSANHLPKLSTLA